MDDVAGIDEPEPEPPAERRGDPAVRELELDVVDLAAVGLDDAFVLVNQLALGVELLRGNGVLGDQGPVPLEIHAGVAEQRLVTRELALRLRQLHLERPRIDLGQEVAGVDVLPFLERHLDQLAVDAGVDGDGVQRRD